MDLASISLLHCQGNTKSALLSLASWYGQTWGCRHGPVGSDKRWRGGSGALLFNHTEMGIINYMKWPCCEMGIGAE